MIIGRQFFFRTISKAVKNTSGLMLGYTKKTQNKAVIMPEYFQVPKIGRIDYWRKYCE